MTITRINSQALLEYIDRTGSSWAGFQDLVVNQIIGARIGVLKFFDNECQLEVPTRRMSGQELRQNAKNNSVKMKVYCFRFPGPQPAFPNPLIADIDSLDTLGNPSRRATFQKQLTKLFTLAAQKNLSAKRLEEELANISQDNSIVAVPLFRMKNLKPSLGTLAQQLQHSISSQLSKNRGLLLYLTPQGLKLVLPTGLIFLEIAYQMPLAKNWILALADKHDGQETARQFFIDNLIAKIIESIGQDSTALNEFVSQYLKSDTLSGVLVEEGYIDGELGRIVNINLVYDDIIHFVKGQPSFHLGFLDTDMVIRPTEESIHLHQIHIPPVHHPFVVNLSWTKVDVPEEELEKRKALLADLIKLAASSQSFGRKELLARLKALLPEEAKILAPLADETKDEVDPGEIRKALHLAQSFIQMPRLNATASKLFANIIDTLAGREVPSEEKELEELSKIVSVLTELLRLSALIDEKGWFIVQEEPIDTASLIDLCQAINQCNTYFPGNLPFEDLLEFIFGEKLADTTFMPFLSTFQVSRILVDIIDSPAEEICQAAENLTSPDDQLKQTWAELAQESSYYYSERFYQEFKNRCLVIWANAYNQYCLLAPGQTGQFTDILEQLFNQDTYLKYLVENQTINHLQLGKIFLEVLSQKKLEVQHQAQTFRRAWQEQYLGEKFWPVVQAELPQLLRETAPQPEVDLVKIGAGTDQEKPSQEESVNLFLAQLRAALVKTWQDNQQNELTPREWLAYLEKLLKADPAVEKLSLAYHFSPWSVLSQLLADPAETSFIASQLDAISRTQHDLLVKSFSELRTTLTTFVAALSEKIGLSPRSEVAVELFWQLLKEWSTGDNLTEVLAKLATNLAPLWLGDKPGLGQAVAGQSETAELVGLYTEDLLTSGLKDLANKLQQNLDQLAPWLPRLKQKQRDLVQVIYQESKKCFGKKGQPWVSPVFFIVEPVLSVKLNRPDVEHFLGLINLRAQPGEEAQITITAKRLTCQVGLTSHLYDYVISGLTHLVLSELEKIQQVLNLLDPLPDQEKNQTVKTNLPASRLLYLGPDISLELAAWPAGSEVKIKLWQPAGLIRPVGLQVSSALGEKVFLWDKLKKTYREIPETEEPVVILNLRQTAYLRGELADRPADLTIEAANSQLSFLDQVLRVPSLREGPVRLVFWQNLEVRGLGLFDQSGQLLGNYYFDKNSSRFREAGEVLLRHLANWTAGYQQEPPPPLKVKADETGHLSINGLNLFLGLYYYNEELILTSWQNGQVKGWELKDSGGELVLTATLAELTVLACLQESARLIIGENKIGAVTEAGVPVLADGRLPLVHLSDDQDLVIERPDLAASTIDVTINRTGPEFCTYTFTQQRLIIGQGQLDQATGQFQESEIPDLAGLKISAKKFKIKNAQTVLDELAQEEHILAKQIAGTTLRITWSVETKGDLLIFKLTREGGWTQELIDQIEFLSFDRPSFDPMKLVPQGVPQLKKDQKTLVVSINNPGQHFFGAKGIFGQTGKLTLDLQSGGKYFGSQQYDIQHDVLSGIINQLRKTTGQVATSGRAIFDFILGLRESKVLAADKKPSGYYNQAINNDKQQQAAVAAGIDLGQPVTLIVGPQGCGKTTVLVEAIRQLLAQGKVIKLTAKDHAAVDNVVQALIAAGVSDVFRAGSQLPSDTPASVRARWLVSSNPDLLQELNRLQRNGQGYVIAGTCLGLETAGYPRELKDVEYDVVVVDEASRMRRTELLLALNNLNDSGKLIAAGDPNQLPPFPLAEELLAELPPAQAALANQSFLAQLLQAGQPKILLDTNWRQPPILAAFVSLLFYHGLLKTGRAPTADFVLRFIDQPGREDRDANESVFNEEEAQLLASLIKEMLDSGQIQDVSEIAAVTPYNAQVEKIRQRVREILGLNKLKPEELEELLAAIMTVNRAQGKEKEQAILSLVRSLPNPKSLGIVAELQRMCVALSRGKNGLTIIGNTQTLCQSSQGTTSADQGLVIQALFNEMLIFIEEFGQILEPEATGKLRPVREKKYKSYLDTKIPEQIRHHFGNAYYNLAISFYQQSRAESAQGNPEPAKSCLDLAKRCLNLALAHQTTAPFLLLQGELENQSGNFRQAREYLTKSLELDPTKEAAYVELAEATLKHGLYLGKTIDLIRNYLKGKNDSPLLWLALARLHDKNSVLEKGQRKDLDCIKNAWDLRSRATAAETLEIGRCYLDLLLKKFPWDLEKIKTICRELLALLPDSAEAVILLVGTYHRALDDAEAAAELSRFCAAGRAGAPAYFQLGQLQLKLEQQEPAKASLLRARELDPKTYAKIVDELLSALSSWHQLI